MSELVPARGYQPAVPRDLGLASARLPRSVQRIVDAEIANGLARAQRINMVGLAAKTAMQNLDELGYLEAAIAQRDPLHADRAAGIISDFTMVARLEVRSMAPKF